jgi:hypothetical protein
MLAWVLARAKLVGAAIAMSASYAALEAVDFQMQKSVGFGIPTEVKAAIAAKIGLITANFTDNVQLLPDGFAIPKPTLPVAKVAEVPAAPAA